MKLFTAFKIKLQLDRNKRINVLKMCVKETEADSGSGFWPLFCIFQWRLHIPETRPHDWRDGGCVRVGASIAGLN